MFVRDACQSSLVALSSELISTCVFTGYIIIHIHVQVLWGGRWQPNSAAGAGEEMEQLFSYLSRFNLTTKYMNAAGIYYKCGIKR